MLIVSGCPRSGTSVMMDIHREVFGEDRILGSKFPQERKEREKQQEGESDYSYQVRKYILEKQELINKAQGKTRDFYDMNPNGFWECKFTVRGIQYSLAEKNLFDRLKLEKDENRTICKVVSQGLFNSIPNYMNKIVYMVRHPRAVAKSQERLKRGFDVLHPDGTYKNMFEDLVVHTPEMYINVTGMAAKFFLKNKDIPVHFVHFEDLMAYPHAELDKIQEFTGFGDYKKAYDVVTPKLDRSKHEEVENQLWPDAEYVYEMFCDAVKFNRELNRNKEMECYREIVKYLNDPKRRINREKRNWPCYRAGQTVTELQCSSCMHNHVVKENFKKHAEELGIEWRNEPCVFECGLDLDRKDDEYLTIRDSIKNNFWK